MYVCLYSSLCVLLLLYSFKPAHVMHKLLEPDDKVGGTGSQILSGSNCSVVLQCAISNWVWRHAYQTDFEFKKPLLGWPSTSAL